MRQRMNETRKAVEGYFSAWTSNQIDEAYAWLAPDLKFAGPSAGYSSAAEFKPALIGFAAITQSARIIELLVDGDRAAMLYDCDFKAPGASVRIASFFWVKNGKIAQYDTRFDPSVLAKLKK